jgi:hypothetical protein
LMNNHETILRMIEAIAYERQKGHEDE